MSRWHKKRGVTLVEVVIGTAILGAVLVAVTFTLTIYIQSAKTAMENTKALYLAEEGIAFGQYLRSDDWTNITGLTVNTDYYFDVTASAISITGTPEVIDTDYTRSFQVDSLYRDSNDDIVDSGAPGAVLDADSRYLQVAVVRDSKTISLSAILTNIHHE